MPAFRAKKSDGADRLPARIRRYGVQRHKPNAGRFALRRVVKITVSAVALFLTCGGAARADDLNAKASVPGAYYGNYQVGPDHMIGIDRFIDDAGKSVALISDYRSGIVRRLFPASNGEFAMGPGFEVESPAEMRLRFVKDAKGGVLGASLEPTSGTASFAKRVPLSEEEVTITNGQVKLAGTLMLPPVKGRHPAIVLLHGSGPLTRYSFGPYPHFFTSLGFAVLIYDKRGTGASTGERVDASTGVFARLPAEYYPNSLADDAVAAFRLLQSRKDIDGRRIGVWGSSEGGMLATQVAARDKNVAFAIDSSGFTGPLWQTVLYQAGAILRGSGAPARQVDEAAAFTRLWMKVARTGEDYDLYLKEREKARADKKFWMLSWWSGNFTSLAQMRWDWDHILSFSPDPALKSVTCPVLGLWGEQDQLSNAPEAARSMRAVLADAGNTDVTVKIFPNANHALMEMPAGARMAPGVFETLNSWLSKRLQIRAPQP